MPHALSRVTAAFQRADPRTTPPFKRKAPCIRQPSATDSRLDEGNFLILVTACLRAEVAALKRETGSEAQAPRVGSTPVSRLAAQKSPMMASQSNRAMTPSKPLRAAGP